MSKVFVGKNPFAWKWLGIHVWLIALCVLFWPIAIVFVVLFSGFGEGAKSTARSFHNSSDRAFRYGYWSQIIKNDAASWRRYK